MRYALVVFMIFAVAISLSTAAQADVGASPISVTSFGDHGWYSDDTRTGIGVDLVGSSNTYCGKPGQVPTAADDAAIAQQIQFVRGPAGATYGGSVKLRGTDGNAGKSTISLIDTVTGIADVGKLVDGTFSATYKWYMEPVTTVRTMAFRIGVRSTNWAASQAGFTAVRSGEPAWDLMLTHVMDAPAANAWNTDSVSLSSGKWYLYGQAGNSNWAGIAGSAPPAGTVQKTLAEWQADPVWGPIVFGSGSKIVALQFGLGSYQRNCNAYLDYAQISFYNGGQLVDFTDSAPFWGAASVPQSLSLAGPVIFKLNTTTGIVGTTYTYPDWNIIMDVTSAPGNVLYAVHNTTGSADNFYHFKLARIDALTGAILSDTSCRVLSGTDEPQWNALEYHNGKLYAVENCWTRTRPGDTGSAYAKRGYIYEVALDSSGDPVSATLGAYIGGYPAPDGALAYRDGTWYASDWRDDAPHASSWIRTSPNAMTTNFSSDLASRNTEPIGYFDGWDFNAAGDLLGISWYSDFNIYRINLATGLPTPLFNVQSQLPSTIECLSALSAEVPAVLINDGDSRAADRVVTLAINPSDIAASAASEMCFSDDGATWSAWEAVAATKAWNLPGGNGSKTVYAQFRDSLGNTSSSFFDTITLEMPELSLVPVGGDVFARPGETLTIDLNVAHLNSAVGFCRAILNCDTTLFPAVTAVDGGSDWNNPMYGVSSGAVRLDVSATGGSTTADSTVAKVKLTAGVVDGSSTLVFATDVPGVPTKQTFLSYTAGGTVWPAKVNSTNIIVDGTAPTVTISAPSAARSADGAPVSYTVSYADSWLDTISLTSGRISLLKTGTANGTVSVSGTGDTRTVTIDHITGAGTLGISVAAGTACDKAGNSAPAAGPSATFDVTYTNVAPQNVSLTPNSDPQPTGTPLTFTSVYSDANGAADMKVCTLLINTTRTYANGIYLRYSVNANKINLMNDDGATYSTAYVPGTAGRILENSQCKVYIADTTVTKAGNNITINWRIELKPSMASLPLKGWMTVQDNALTSDSDQMAAYFAPVTPIAPTIVGLFPTGGWLVPGSNVTFETAYTDGNGADDITECRLIVAPTIAATGVRLCYVKSTNKVYLGSTGTTWGTGYTPGSAVMVSNGACTLDVANTVVISAGNDLYIYWQVRIDAPISGPAWMLVKDSTGLMDGYRSLGRFY